MDSVFCTASNTGIPALIAWVEINNDNASMSFLNRIFVHYVVNITGLVQGRRLSVIRLHSFLIQGVEQFQVVFAAAQHFGEFPEAR